MRLTTRILKLERHIRKGNPVICPVCQFAVGCGEIPPERITFEVPVPGAFGEAEPIDDPANDFCKGCGRRVVLRLGFDKAG